MDEPTWGPGGRGIYLRDCPDKYLKNITLNLKILDSQGVLTP